MDIDNRFWIVLANNKVRANMNLEASDGAKQAARKDETGGQGEEQQEINRNICTALHGPHDRDKRRAA